MSKRRPNGDGMVRKRPDGRWEARIVVGHKEDGRPIYKSVFGKTQSEVTVKLHTMIDAFRGVDLTEDCLVTLGGWLDRWLAYMQKIIRPTTLKKYVFYANAYVRPYLGNKKVSAVTVADVQRLYNKLQKAGRVNLHPKYGYELSGNTVRAVHMMLHEALEMAVNERILASNPTDGTTIPKLIVNEMKVWNSGQLKRFLSAIEADPVWHDFFYTACMTGLRRGELCGLRWEDFDEVNGRLQVRHTVIIMPGGKLVLGEPKTETGIREFVLPPSVTEMLRQRKQIVQSEWVFPQLNDSSKPTNPNAAYHKFKWLLKKNGLPEIKLHDLRHTFATHAIALGVDEKTLAGVLGHTKPSFTLDRYTHVTSEMQERAAGIVGDALGKILGKELKA